MKNKSIENIIAMTLTLAVFIIAVMVIPPPKPVGEITIVEVEQAEAAEDESLLSHRQEVWLHALEWCESRGVTTAINEQDLDGTPSYYSFQFKPGTFRHYGEKYGVIESGLSDERIMELIKEYELQKQIVSHMILDESVRWETQFPWCVKKLGRPPRN